MGIETPGSSGSGFIIGKKDHIYYFITAGHVVSSDPKDEEYWVYSVAKGSSKKYRVNSFIKPKEFYGKDIVIGSFKSKDELQISLIFPLDNEKYVPKSLGNTYQNLGFFNGRPFYLDWEIQGMPIIGGVSIPTKTINVPLFRTSPISLQDRAFGNQSGYEVIYSLSSTVPGMSGSGLFAARWCDEKMKWSPIGGIAGAYPGVIGMHGLSEEYANSGSRSGTSLGIPLDLFIDFFGKNSDKFGIPIGQNYFNEVERICQNDSFYY